MTIRKITFFTVRKANTRVRYVFCGVGRGKYESKTERKKMGVVEKNEKNRLFTRSARTRRRC